MPASSLIFLLIIAIWAAYLLQHWIRRREHLATARSVDRFSEAMRVLERRNPLPQSPLSAPEPRSYAVSPARPAHPEVLVKRAHPDPAPSRAPTVPAAAQSPGAAPETKRPGSPRSWSARRVRGISLLTCVALLLVSSVLAPLGTLPWWSVAVAGALVVGDLGWLRHAARQPTRPHAPERASTQREAAPAGAVAAYPSRVTRVTAAYDVDADIPARQHQAAPTSTRAEVDPRTEPAGPAGVDDPPTRDPHGWDPVPVPPPTYTLKAKAERPPVSIDDLPFDGNAMRLDEESEDLPSVYQAG